MSKRPSPLPEKLPTLSGEFQKQIRELYAELASEMQALGPVCDQSGRCCRFHEYDHELWLTDIELSYLFELAGKKPLSNPGVCPYLENNSCTAREGRALGCRIYFCRLAETDLQEISNTYLQKLSHLAKTHGLEISYGEFQASLDPPSPPIASSPSKLR